MEYLSVKKVKNNPNNPRTITEDNFKKLVKSIKDFPKMLELRPLVVDENMVVLGGNMRLKACIEAGLKKVPVLSVQDLTEEQKKEFIIKDNIGFGDWDWANLGTEEWKKTDLKDWGLAIWDDEDDVDYSALDDDSVDNEVSDMTGGVKKAIQIEFDIEHFEEATTLVKYFRENDAYVGALLIEKLRAEKTKMEKAK